MRRTCLVAVLIAMVGLVTPAVAGDRHEPTPAGTWVVKTLFDGYFQLAHLQNFTMDGRTTLLLPTGPGHPNEGDSRIGCMGEWRPRPGRASREFDVTLRCMYDQNWEGIYGDIRAVVRLSQTGRTFNADFTYTDLAADGTVVSFGPGVMTGERIGIKPLP